jgi:hypothetical protein
MVTIEAPETDFKEYMPSDLSECDDRQYIEMCELIFQMQTQQINFDELKTHAVYRLLNMVPAKSTTEEEDLNKFGNVYKLSQKIESFFETQQDNQKVIKQNYIHNPIPVFRPAFRTFYGPTNQFMNIKFGEYCDALRLFYDFNTTGDINLLYDICAIFYRPSKSFHFIKKHLPDYDGDIRQAYNSNHVEKRANIFHFAPIGFVYGVYLYFASFQKFITTAIIPWGGKDLNLSILFQTDGDRTNEDALPDAGMDSVMFMMAESNVFGTQKELNNTSIWMVWVRMYDIRRKDIEQQKQLENAERNQT